MDADSHEWIPLVEYSAKHNVSLSTLRRRIKAGQVAYRVDQGKYLLCDESIARQRYQSEKILSHVTGAHSALKELSEESSEGQELKSQDPPGDKESSMDHQLNSLYEQILSEKDRVIYQLKDQVSDLKRLVETLEAENTRLRKFFELEIEPNSEESVLPEVDFGDDTIV